MKYLKLYEAFESEILSKTMQFIKKNSKSSTSDFKNKLDKIMEIFDIQLSKMSDSDFKYLNKKLALNLKSENEIQNEWGIKYLKFWFSIENGYLGFTATGDKSFEYSPLDAVGFTEKDKEKIKSITTTGKLIPVDGNLESLQTGDKVLGLFSGDRSDVNDISLATIWREDDRIWAIQNVASGSTPESGIEQFVERIGRQVPWQYFGRYGWSLGRVNDPGDDFYFLNRFIESDEELFPTSEIDKSHPLCYNLPVSRGGKFTSWDSQWSMRQSDLDKVDFCLVFDLNEFIKKNQTVSSVKSLRKELKSGATKLMSDEEIRNQNIERYLDYALKKHGISDNTGELVNLQRLIQKCLCGDFILISLFRGRPSTKVVERIISNILEILRNPDSSDVTYYYREIRDNYNSLSKESLRYQQLFNKTKSSILSYRYKVDEDELWPEISELVVKFLDISKKTNQLVGNLSITTVEDLEVLLEKLYMIGKLISESSTLSIDTSLRRVLKDFYDESDAIYYLKNAIPMEDEEFEKTQTKLNKIDNYITSILK